MPEYGVITYDPETNITSIAIPKYSPYDLFKRSFKKDPSLFPILQDMAHWDN